VLLQRGKTLILHHESHHTAARNSLVCFHKEQTHKVSRTNILLFVWPSEQGQQDTSKVSTGSPGAADGINLGRSAIAIRFLQTEATTQFSISPSALHQHGHGDAV